MIRHFFLDKTNSIIKRSEQNIGLNPILHVCYGANTMRSILHFDVEKIKCLLEDKTFADREKLTFTLKMTNCFSVDGFPYNKQLIRGLSEKAKRATSFDLMLYKLPCHFDMGRGFDYISDMWVHDNQSFSKDGSSWYCCKTGILWDGSLKPKSLKEVNGDIYDKDFINEEYQKHIDGKDSIIIGTQHFDFGNENLSIDITDYVYSVVDNINDINYGLCISFTPEYEEMESEYMEYVGFFGEHTNTFFHPYVEAKYNEYVFDSRESFTNKVDNKLYLYCSFDGQPVNLDNIPTCNIGGVELPVKQSTKGVYYAEIKASDIELTEGTMEYDTWSNIALNGLKNDDVEMEFVVNPNTRKVMFGNNSELRREFVPSFYGINDDEVLTQNEIREVVVDFRQKYETDKKELVNSADYRLYVKDGNRELDVLPYQPVEKAYLNNFFVLYTEDLIPNQYFIDIRVQNGRETKYYKGALRFKIVDNVTERYQ